MKNNQIQLNPNGNNPTPYKNPQLITVSIDTARISQGTWVFHYATTNERGEVVKTTATATANDKGRIYLPTTALGLDTFRPLDITEKVKYQALPSSLSVDYRLTKRSQKEQALKSLTTTITSFADIDNNLEALKRVLLDIDNGTATINEASKGASLVENIVGATLNEYGYNLLLEKIERKQSTLEKYKTAVIPECISEENRKKLEDGNRNEVESIGNELSQLGREKAKILALVEPLQDLGKKCLEYYNNGKREASEKMRASIGKAVELANLFLNK